MKKLILASAFALMATPALFAQSDNSFSMQIELKNGTKITLGPNDLKNISFVDGHVAKSDIFWNSKPTGAAWVGTPFMIN